MTKSINQVLPGIRMLPQLKVSEELASELIDIAGRAYRLANSYACGDANALAAIFAPARAQQAAEFFVSEKHYETSVPNFRSILAGKGKDGQLRRMVSKLSDFLDGADYQVPFVQLRALYCYGDPQSNGNAFKGAEELEEQNRRISEWAEEFSPSAIRAALIKWSELMDECLVQTRAAGAPEKTAERNFVAHLGGYWRSELKARPGNSRAESAEGYRQTGLFAEFVRTAAKIIPMEYRPDSFEHAIRGEVERREVERG